ncbi:hypothetical protein BDV38DRAFT_250643 [Aspergillus pseudotamarii]|uniref:Uncharacterized protein n=1 Tax=Aspergillus pseudotamarii TaxID=132259 RepID=A0A5N6SNG9_ASPPS|nr:uncharacterized protein BDV38DRAFT_250643 [Aspergillus pseudotamarii]KAE8136125.1 hypothetical protein BDV38DRAFT_250643 [Aspergillus pseudotamarii]
MKTVSSGRNAEGKIVDAYITPRRNSYAMALPWGHSTVLRETFFIAQTSTALGYYYLLIPMILASTVGVTPLLRPIHCTIIIPNDPDTLGSSSSTDRSTSVKGVEYSDSSRGNPTVQ